MQFRCNDVQGVIEYDYSYGAGWSEKVKNYYNKDEIIDVDFDVVIESYFTVDFLNGKFIPVDQEAQDWAKTLQEFMQTEEAIA
jgi:hypothetical protein